MGLVLLQAPAEPVVTLDEALLHLRVDGYEESSLVQGLVEAATAHAEAFCRRRFVTQRWRLTRDAFPTGAIVLPHPPLASVESVAYVDQDGALQVVPPADYVVRTAETPGEVAPAYGTSWPSARAEPDAVRVEFTCGYGAAVAVPEAIRRAVLLVTGSLYRDRENASPVALTRIPTSAEWLLGPFVVRRFCA